MLSNNYAEFKIVMLFGLNILIYGNIKQKSSCQGLGMGKGIMKGRNYKWKQKNWRNDGHVLDCADVFYIYIHISKFIKF